MSILFGAVVPITAASPSTQIATTSISAVCTASNPSGICDSASFLMWGFILIFNIATFFLLRAILPNIKWSDTLTEKYPPSYDAQKTLDAVDASIAKAKEAGIVVTTTSQQGDDSQPSYSRAIGTLGGAVIIAFFWASVNLVLYFSFENMSLVTTFAQSIWPLYLAGSALLLPYAFNKLSTIFQVAPQK
jgi:hypothetical protein